MNITNEDAERNNIKDFKTLVGCCAVSPSWARFIIDHDKPARRKFLSQWPIGSPFVSTTFGLVTYPSPNHQRQPFIERQCFRGRRAGVAIRRRVLADDHPAVLAVDKALR